MKRLILMSVFALSGCVVTEFAAQDQQGVTVERKLGPGRSETYRLVGPDWSCEGNVKTPQLESVTTRNVPMTCTDGATGNAEVVYSSNLRQMQINTSVTVNYRLSNGKTGSARV